MTEDSEKKLFQLVIDEFDLELPGIDELHEDAPFPLHNALFLPELGGSSWEKSSLVTINELRAAVRRQEL